MRSIRLTNKNSNNKKIIKDQNLQRYSPSIQNLIEKKYNLTSYRSFYIPDQAIKNKREIKQVDSLRATQYSPIKIEKSFHRIPLQIYPQSKNKKVQGIYQLQYQQEPNLPNFSLRKRYIQAYNKRKKSPSPKKIQNKISQPSLKELRKKQIRTRNNIVQQIHAQQKQHAVEQKDKLITYYRQKYDNKKLNDVRGKVDYEKRKRINMLLQRALQNKPQISYRSYEPLKTKDRFLRPSAPVYQPKEDDFSLLDPW